MRKFDYIVGSILFCTVVAIAGWLLWEVKSFNEVALQKQENYLNSALKIN